MIPLWNLSLPARMYGFRELIINVHRALANRLYNFLTPTILSGFIFAFHTKKILCSTPAAAKHASWFFADGAPFLVHNVDILSDLDLYPVYRTPSHKSPGNAGDYHAPQHAVSYLTRSWCCADGKTVKRRNKKLSALLKLT